MSARRSPCRAAAVAIASALALCVTLALGACAPGLFVDPEAVTWLGGGGSWTIMVVMSADNDLEAQAIEDLNELEAAPALDSTTVLVLIDRAPGYDDSNGDWTGTRLYRVVHDPDGIDREINSLPLALPSLGLEVDVKTELDLADPRTIRAFVEFADEAFPAQHTALIVWGHGSGYRSVDSPGTRVSAWDDTNGDSLTTAELGSAIRGVGIDLLGLDTCFGASIELAYEVREGATLLVASENEEPADGWEYDDVLARFAGSDGTPRALADAIVESYAAAYATSADATIGAIALDRIFAVRAALDDFADALYDAIADGATRDAVRAALFYDVEEFYTTPGDLSIDLADAAFVVGERYDLADEQAQTLQRLLTGEDGAILRSWSGSANPRATGLAIHLIPLAADGTALLHDDSYVRGASTDYPLAFVNESSWPPALPDGPGLLYRLFYESFDFNGDGE